MKKIWMLGIALLGVWTSDAQEKKFDFKFYGRIRGDLMYNSRASQESVDGLFYMYPLDEKLDAEGADLNDVPASNFYMLYTRLGVNIKAPQIGKARTTAQVEIDFRGSGTTFTVPRIRQAWVMLDWTRHDLLIGQTWHPLTGEVTATMLNLSTGAPFQPFNRTPMLRYRYKAKSGVQLTLATIWQMQYNSPGPDGKSYKYLKNSCVPEVFFGVDYKKNGWIAGVGGELISLKPRQQAEADSKTYKVQERITTLSAEAHVKYTAPKWNIAAKSTFGNNISHLSMLGGYAVSAIDRQTGEQEYTPYRHSSTWVNLTVGKKWQSTLFMGYVKNLGTPKEIVGAKYGTGLDIDQLASVNVSLSYNLPHWKIGAEFTPSVAWYGKADSHGKISDTHSVTNYRLLAVAMFMF